MAVPGPARSTAKNCRKCPRFAPHEGLQSVQPFAHTSGSAASMVAIGQNDRLRHLIRQLQRMRFGRCSDKLDPDHLNPSWKTPPAYPAAARWRAAFPSRLGAAPDCPSHLILRRDDIEPLRPGSVLADHRTTPSLQGDRCTARQERPRKLA